MTDFPGLSAENCTVIKGDINSVCRCCLVSENLVKIFEDSIEFNAELADIFKQNYISVAITDELPNFICSSCLESLRSWHRFREKCQETFRLLEALREYKIEYLENSEQHCADTKMTIEEVNFEQEVPHDSPHEQPQYTLSDSGPEAHATEDEEKKLESQLCDNEDRKTKKIVVDARGRKRYYYQRQCPVCGVVIKRGMKQHMLIHNDPTGKPFKCDSCEKTYCRKENLRLHREREHLNIRYPCDVCGKIFTTKDILSAHRKLHNSDGQFKCDQCDQSFNSNKYLYKHKQKHSGVKKFVCSFCGKSFRVGEYLKDHLRIHTGERPFECTVCGKQFRTATHLRQHGRIHQQAATELAEGSNEDASST